MRYNQYSYTPQDLNTALAELRELGFDLSLDQSDLVNFETFVRKTQLNYQDTDFPLSNLLADWETDLLSFFQSGRQLTDQVFYMVALQLLDFIPHVDFEDLDQFLGNLNFPIRFGQEPLLVQLYHLLNCRGKEGMTLIDTLVSQDLIPVDNAFHYFNGKSLATFDTSKLIREIVYVEAPLDTDGDGQRDLIKVRIIRPQTSVKLPALMTASPYHEGTNVPANDKKLYPMEGELTVKAAGTIQVQPTVFEELPAQTSTAPISQSQESFTHTSTYSLNDYMLARGFASLYVAGVGTAGSQGFMTSGDYAQIASFKAVIDWLNGRATAYTSHKRDYQVQADWATGTVATTGKSYLGTMSTGLATTGVEGLRLIIAEAAISSWYDYYRENGLVCSPGGYPGEDLDVLTELTYSRNMVPGDYLKNNARYQALLKEQSAQLDRQTGDYNQFWQDRNYLPHAEKIGIDLVYTHGLQDWNVKPGQVYQILKALPATIRSHTFLHQGEHVYLNNWQSIDFRESMNALLCQKLLDLYNRFELPTVIWQDNSQEQTWQDLETFGRDNLYQIPLGQGEKTIQNQYPQETFDRYGKNFRAFKSDLFEGKAQALVLDIPLSQDLHLNGKPRLNLRLKSSQNRGILSAQLLDYGQKKGFSDLPAYLTLNSLDNGRNFAKEGLRELPFKEQAYRVVSKVVLNLQNRTDLLTIQEVQPDQWMDLTLELQPTIYKLATGDKLRVLLYTTDFEHTIRDNSDYQLTLDLDQSWLELPVE